LSISKHEISAYKRRTVQKHHQIVGEAVCVTIDPKIYKDIRISRSAVCYVAVKV
jgi:hypothetical protein